MSDELLAALRPQRAALWLAVHCNHARELGAAARAALARLADRGIPLMGQTVLLAGVNDDVETLDEADARPGEVPRKTLLPAPSRPGARHQPFPRLRANGQALMKALRGRLSGLAQPTYVLDVPGGHGKVPIGPATSVTIPTRCWFEDAFGQTHRYPR